MTQLCFCHSGIPYRTCCETYHRGKRPLTPLALMRSRYAAFSLGKISYILKTESVNLSRRKNAVNYRKELKAYCQMTEFVGLHILAAPSASETKGTVTFRAIMVQNGRDVSFTEKSFFEKTDGMWIYMHGETM